MNERIKELADQAHCYACEFAQQSDYNEYNPYNQAMYKQRYDSKFAELIVRECAQLVGGYTKENEFGADVKEAYEEITKHFGVKVT